MIERACDLANGHLIRDWIDPARPIRIMISPGLMVGVASVKEIGGKCVLIPTEFASVEHNIRK